MVSDAIRMDSAAASKTPAGTIPAVVVDMFIVASGAFSAIVKSGEEIFAEAGAEEEALRRGGLVEIKKI